ncbi:FG-GAP repeat protein [Peterkaempfera griseoplana]|uniref:FG-GAP repeat protein n=1 Tax=Peterkaempfera griseoplana TaxID=66896 RepID=UPI0006E3418E|nr:FG-GAP repeat protein [Peterkaempfera griseoplana]
MDALNSITAVGDINHDGHNDLLAVSNSKRADHGNRLVLYTGKGDGTFNAGRVWANGWSGVGGLF